MDTKKIFPFDIFGKPKLCLQCDRLSYLRCFCCDTIYCSGECQLKDWVSHHELFYEDKAGDQLIPIDKIKQEEIEAPDELAADLTVDDQQEEPTKTIVEQEKTKEQHIKDLDTKTQEAEIKKSRQKDIPSKSTIIYSKSQGHRSSAPFYGNFDPNSMTYKLMEPKFPENVKNGVKISVQGRLAKALEKSGKGIVSSDGSSQVKQEKGAIPKNFDKIERSKSNKDKENSGYHYFSLDDW